MELMIKIINVHKNPAPKKRIKIVMNNSLSKCKSTDDNIFLIFKLEIKGAGSCELEDGSYDSHNNYCLSF